MLWRGIISGMIVEERKMVKTLYVLENIHAVTREFNGFFPNIDRSTIEQFSILISKQAHNINIIDIGIWNLRDDLEYVFANSYEFAGLYELCDNPYNSFEIIDSVNTKIEKIIIIVEEAR